MEDKIKDQRIEEGEEMRRRMTEWEHLAFFPRLNPNPLLEVDSSGAITFHNMAASETLKQLGMKALSVFFPDDFKEILRALERKRQAKFSRRVELKDRVFGENIYLIPDFNVVHIYASDITDRRRMEEALQENEERYRNLFHNAQMGLYRTRISDGMILEVNLRAAQIYGYNNREECIGNYIASKHYMDEGTRERALKEMEKNGEVKNFEARMFRKDGSIYWALYSARLHPDKGYIEGLVEDITERKKLEEEREKLIKELQEALAKVKTLSGLLPICASCKKIRDDKGYWNQIEIYLRDHSQAEFSHGLCPDCLKKLYPDYFTETPESKSS